MSRYKGLDRERIGEPARFDVLRELSAITGGKVVKREQVDEILAEIQQLPEPEPLVRRLRIWAHPIWALVLISLLGVFWSGRKLVGQV